MAARGKRGSRGRLGRCLASLMGMVVSLRDRLARPRPGFGCCPRWSAAPVSKSWAGSKKHAVQPDLPDPTAAVSTRLTKPPQGPGNVSMSGRMSTSTTRRSWFMSAYPHQYAILISYTMQSTKPDMSLMSTWASLFTSPAG
jgi:hypothetical protein